MACRFTRLIAVAVFLLIGVQAVFAGAATLDNGESTESDSTTAYRLDGEVEAIYGSVLAADDGAPLTGQVLVYDNAGNEVDRAMIDNDGSYQSKPLLPGYYFVRFQPTDPRYRPEIYDDVACVGACIAAADGTPVIIEPGSGAEANASLPPAASLSGTLRADDSGAALSGFVFVFDQLGVQVASKTIGVDGQYEVLGLAAGEYFIRFEAVDPRYVTELYDGIECLSSCDVTAGSPIALALGEGVEIDASLGLGSTISGLLTAAEDGRPVVGRMQLFRESEADGSFVWVTAVVSDSAGFYTTGALESGVYRLSFSADEFLSEVYADQPCSISVCDINSGTDVVVGTTSVEIDAALAQGTYIEGVVSAADTGRPFGQVLVTLYTTDWQQLDATRTSANGTYRLSNLPDGEYFLAFEPADGPYLREFHAGISCPPGCTITDLAPTPIVLSAAPQVIDANLDQGLILSGRISDQDSGEGLASGYLSIYDSAGARLAILDANQSGHYQSGGLGPGSYFLLFNGGVAYVAEVHQDISCQSECVPVLGTPVVLTGSDVTINAGLRLGTTIRGQITDAAKGTPLPASIGVHAAASGTLLTRVFTDLEGRYETRALPNGDYKLFFDADNADYIDEVYDNAQCLRGRCDIRTTGSAITIADSSLTVDAALARGASLFGDVTAGDSGLALPGWVTIYPVNGDSPIGGPIDSAGHYRSIILEPGDYRLLFEPDNTDYVAQAHRNLPCPARSCDPSGRGDPVSIGLESVAVDAELALGHHIAGTVAASDSNRPIGQGSVQLFGPAGQASGSATLNANGEYRTEALPAGQYLLKFHPTGLFSDYIVEVYDDLYCPGFTCDISVEADPVEVDGETLIDAFVDRGNRLTGTVREQDSGLALEQGVVWIFDQAGRIASTAVVAVGDYFSAALPPDQYYVVFESTDVAYGDELYDEVPCDQVSCGDLPSLGTAVTLDREEVRLDEELTRVLLFRDGFETSAALAGSVD